MEAVLGGLGAAFVFATATLCNARSSRMIGPSVLLGWIMGLGLLIILVPVAADGVPDGLDAESLGWMAVAGVGNVVGLLLAYSALRIGKVGLVAPLVSTQGAVAAVIAVIAGESISTAVALLLGVIAVGIFLAGVSERPDAEATSLGRGRAGLYAVAAALAIGASLYAIGRVSSELTVAWSLLPSRMLGTAVVTLPLMLGSRLVMTRDALPLVLVAAACEVGGFALFAWGARHGIAIAAVLSSQFAVIAAVAAYVLFRERLTSAQVAGVTTVVLAVAILAGVQAD
jgi:drug/metabolite transporter (DMT)-like permease